jgi:hypothetical protein
MRKRWIAAVVAMLCLGVAGFAIAAGGEREVGCAVNGYGNELCGEAAVAYCEILASRSPPNWRSIRACGEIGAVEQVSRACDLALTVRELDRCIGILEDVVGD